jgi:hypothetical protein
VRIAIVALVAALTGCTASMQGYENPNSERDWSTDNRECYAEAQEAIGDRYDFDAKNAVWRRCMKRRGWRYTNGKELPS